MNLAQRIAQEFKTIRNDELTLKANQSSTYTKTEVDSAIPTNVSDLTNDSGFQTGSQVDSKIAVLTSLAPATLDTFKEIADQLVTDQGAVTALTSVVSNKVDKVTGKGLSTEDYTSVEKTKLAGIATGAQVNTVDSVAGKTGVVTLVKADVGLSNVDNTTDLLKPLSTATINALALKATLVSPILTTPNIGVATGTSFNSITGLASVAPVMDGVATIGTSAAVARQDHVHPSDTSKTNAADLMMAIGNINSPLLDMPLKNSLAMKAGVGTATFTRASTATYIDRYGVLKSAAINEPRFEKEGYLNEGASTNLLIYSEQFDNANWYKEYSTLTANTTDTLDPYGTNLATKIMETAVSSSHALYTPANISFTAGVTYTQSWFIKPNGRSIFHITSYASTVFTTLRSVLVNLTTKTITVLQGVVSNYKLEELANGWFRVQLSYMADATGTTFGAMLRPRLDDGVTEYYLGDITKGFYVFGAQLEALPFASSYIPTVANTVTRAGDVLSVSYLNNTAGCNNRFSEETLMFDIVRKPQKGITHLFDTLFNGTAYRWYAWDNNLIAQYGADAVGGSQLPTNNTTPYIKYRTTLSHDKSGVTKSYMNGVLTATGSSGNANSADVITGLHIGHKGNGGGQCNGHYSNFRVYDKALTAMEVALA